MNEIINFFNLILQRQQSGEDLILATITTSSGSVPRGAGAHMLIGKEGRIFGTIGGGAVEYRVEQEARTALNQKSSMSKSYDLSQNAADLGMVCGGTVTVYLRYLPAQKAAGEYGLISLCQFALDSLMHNAPLWLLLPLSENEEEAIGFFQPQKGYFPPRFSYLEQELLCLEKESGVIAADGVSCYVEQISTKAFVHVFGGGHVARELVPLLSHTGFACAVYDDREDFLKKEDFPNAHALVLVDFDRLEQSLVEAQENYFVIMTRGHKHDTLVQAFAMRVPSAYIGVMGSRKKIAFVFGELKKQGFTDEDLARIHTPIGISIAAETPAEISVSITAELIQVRSELKKI